MMRVSNSVLVSVLGVSLLATLMLGTTIDESSLKQATELLYGRSSQLATDLDFPEPVWSSPKAEEGMFNNIGSGNLKIDKTIRSIKSMQHEPELAASIHMLETSSKRASDALDDLQFTGSTLVHTPVLPDPEGLIKRLHRLRLHSSWCRKHSNLCSDTPDVTGVIDPSLKDSDDEDAEQPKETVFKNRNKRILAARTQQLWNEPDDSTQQFTQKDIQRMPWLSSYVHLRKNKLEQDPLWCGASHCEERGYARHRHNFAEAIPHAIAVNEPLAGSGGTIETDPHEKSHFSYARATRRPGGLRPAALQAAPARLQELAAA
jgi:hypothetical protein